MFREGKGLNRRFFTDEKLENLHFRVNLGFFVEIFENLHFCVGNIKTTKVDAIMQIFEFSRKTPQLTQNHRLVKIFLKNTIFDAIIQIFEYPYETPYFT